MNANLASLLRGMSRRAWFRTAPLLTTAAFSRGSLGANVGPHRSGSVRTVDDLDTPAMIIDLDLLERNIRMMQEICRRADIPLQVHTKTHKIPEIAHMQLREGAVGICCQKLGEAEMMVAANVRENILIPYNIVGEQKLIRLSRLSKRSQLTLAVDSEITAQGISDGSKKTADRCGS